MNEHKITADGSSSLYSAVHQQTYHSLHGALSESNHVFINKCLKQLPTKETLHIFEVALGTGLNAFLTLKYAVEHNVNIVYHTIEPYPLDITEVALLNFSSIIPIENGEALFKTIHSCNWNEKVVVHPNFSLIKSEIKLEDFHSIQLFDGIYYDAFSPNAQPELWTTETFIQLKNMMQKGAILTTYCAKGQVRRNMESAGLKVIRTDGPPGKREMLQAINEV